MEVERFESCKNKIKKRGGFMVVRASIVEKKFKLKKLTRLLATRCGRKKKGAYNRIDLKEEKDKKKKMKVCLGMAMRQVFSSTRLVPNETRFNFNKRVWDRFENFF